MLIALLVLVALACALLLVLVVRRTPTLEPTIALARFDQVASDLHQLESALRDESARAAAALRDDLGGRVDRSLILQGQRTDELRREIAAHLDALSGRVSLALAEARTESRSQLADFAQTLRSALESSRTHQGEQLTELATRFDGLARLLTESGDRLRGTVETRLGEMATQNAAKLDELRATVDQRLQATLEQRLDASFKLVGDNLERVIRSLGEMQAIAVSVGDLKRVLTNVKTRGTWGEVQLASLLGQILTSDQYEANVAPVPGSGARVEFAIKLPGASATDGPVWLPVDAKFPTEDYQRLVDASDRADPEAVKAAVAALAQTVRTFARGIAEKYLAPPHTTDFALLFLPTEGLYAEIVRQPGLLDSLQTQHRVVVVGPTTLAALLNSLQLGFRTLAIQQRSSEVWTVLGAVKTEFSKFTEVLANVKRRLEAASSEVDRTGARTRAIERKLRDIEALPASDAARLIGADDNDATRDPPAAG
ncbi:MAG: DNA recombination protein RmuC [Opitutaceae bacterium]|nr:DNA recombination protein RmuC [Opitutaceae bacterium]